MTNDEKAGGGGEKENGQGEKGAQWISGSGDMKGEETMDGMEKTKRDEHFAHPPLALCDPPLPDGKTGKIRVRPLCRQPSWLEMCRFENTSSEAA